MLKYAKNDWLRPLDDLWEKYKDEYKLGDFAESVVNSYRYEGKLYVLPHTVNVMLFFYRKDLFEAAGKPPPKTIAEYAALAKAFNTPARAGTISCQKPVDASLNETHWFISALGDGWFDDSWHPIFNDEKGVEAVSQLKEITAYAQRGLTSAANDECMIALQQDLAAMGLQWATRAAAIDDPDKSRIVGKMDWVKAPDGHARLSGDGYGISAYSSKDPDMLFRILVDLVQRGQHAGCRGADGAAAQLGPERPGGRAALSLLSGGPGFVAHGGAVPAAARVLRGRRLHQPARAAGAHR